jgi:tRNA A-37 threonylcarbamoyl transferase component Bud32
VTALGWVARSRGLLREEGVVALEDLGNAPTLGEALAPDDPRARRRAIEEAGRTVGALHAANFSHGDLHAGNLLLRNGGRFVLFDLHRTRPRANASVRVRDLAFLLHSLRLLSEAERARLVRSYAAATGRSFAEVARAVLPALAERALRRARGAARNAFAPRYGREPFVSGSWRGTRYRGNEEALARALRASPNLAPARWHEERLSDGSLWIRTVPASGARAAWSALHGIAVLDLPVATPVAWASDRRRSLLVVETARGCAPFPEAFARGDARSRLSLAHDLGALVRRLHFAGALASSFFPDGLLVARDAGDLLVADPGRLRFLVPPGKDERAADAKAFAQAFSPPLEAAEARRALRALDPFGTLGLG